MVMADETVPFAHERLNELCAQALSQDQEATIMKLGKEILSLQEQVSLSQQYQRKSQEI